MAFYKVLKTMQYTETLYIEADSEKEAIQMSGQMFGEQSDDCQWYDSEVEQEISLEEYEENEHTTE